MQPIDLSLFPRLSAERRSALERIAVVLGDQAAFGLLASSPEQQLDKLEQFESFSNAQKLQGEQMVQEQLQTAASLTAAMLQSAAEPREALEREVNLVARAATSLSSAAAAPAVPSARLRAVKIGAPKFDGTQVGKLIHWLLAVERCAKAQLIGNNE